MLPQAKLRRRELDFYALEFSPLFIFFLCIRSAKNTAVSENNNDNNAVISPTERGFLKTFQRNRKKLAGGHAGTGCRGRATWKVRTCMQIRLMASMKITGEK